MILLALQLHYIIETLLIGILASLIVAIFIELWHNRGKKYRLSAKLDSVELYSPGSKSDVCIKVDYKGVPVDNALVVLHISITNDGKEDIKFDSHFSEKIHISCKGYRFLSISTKNDKVRAACELCDDGAYLNWDIIKKRESIKLSIVAQLIETSSKTIDRVDCFNNLSFEFRSDCIDSIEVIREMTRKDSIWKFQYSNALVKYVYIILICLIFFVFDMHFSSRYDITYNGERYQNANLLFSPLFGKYLLNSDSASTKVLDIEDVQNILSITPSETKNLANRISSILEIVILVTLVISHISVFINEVQYSIRKKKAKKQDSNSRISD